MVSLRSKYSFWTLAALGSALTAICLFLGMTPGDDGLLPVAAGDIQTGDGTTGNVSTETANVALLTVPEAGGEADAQRREAQGERFPLHVRVQDEEGQPIPRATLSWTELRASENGEVDGVALALELIDVSCWSMTDEQGHALFDDDPFAASVPSESIVWVSREGFQADAIVLGAEAGWRGRHLTCTLGAAPPLVAQVRVRSGREVNQGRVLQLGLGLGDLRISDRDNSWFRDGNPTGLVADDALRCFVRTYTCDGEGRVGIARGAIPTRLTALATGLRSGPEVTKAEDGLIDLFLANEWRVQGFVKVPLGGDIPADARVNCRWKSDLNQQVLGEFPVSQLGRWGPVILPRREQGNYIFRLLGGEFIPEEKTEAASSVPALLEVNFDAVYGEAQAVLVRGPLGNLVDGARVEAIWPVESGWQRSRGWTASDGIAWLHGCPHKTSWIRISKPGFVIVNQPNVHLIYPYPVEFSLEAAGVVEGRVLHDGEPVEDFQVFSWVESPVSRVVRSFSNRKDGRFMLDRVDLGRLSLLASSPDYPAGKAVTLEVSAGERAQAEFDLPSGGGGSGRVLDAVTGAPISGATVELVTQFSSRPLGGRGRVSSVNADGYFRVQGVRLDLPLIKASAPGRLPVNSGGKLQPDGSVDFGVIHLSGRADLHVRVHSEGPIEEFTTYFGSNGPFGIPVVPVPPDGVLLIPDVAPGDHMMKLVFLDGTNLVQYVRLQPGRDWLVEFDHNPLDTLDVLLVPPQGQEVPPDASLHVQFRTSTGNLATRSVVVESADKPTRMTHIPSGEILLFASGDGDYMHRLASQQFILGPDRSQVIELQLGGKTLEVTAIDAQGLRLEQGVVILDSALSGDLFNEAVSMPAGGAFVLDAIPVDELLVTVRHAKLGLGFERVRMKNSGVTKVEVQVGGPELQVRVRDGAHNVSGVDVRLIPAGVLTAGFLGKTDEEGLWTFEGIPSHHYALSLERHGYWPVRHEVEFEGQDLVELAIRQRGDLELTMTLPSGQVVAHQSVTLRSVADDKHVRDWLVDRLLATSAVQLVSDEEGHGFARGIPRGAYAWELVRPDGARVSGECDVPGGEVGEVSIVIPEP